jgi:hypothetical protein
MACAFLDDKLKKLLVRRLVNDSKVSRRAFEFNGALGTFSTRIDFAYLLGLLPKNAQLDLHKLRAVRNKFAHVSDAMTFEHEHVAPICHSLYFHGVAVNVPPRSKFTRSVMSLLALVETAAHDITDKRESLKEVRMLWEKLGLGEYPLKDHYVN